MTRAERHRRLYMLFFLLGEHRGADEPRVLGDADDADRDHGVLELGAENRNDDDGKQDAGKGQHHVHDAHEEKIRPPARVSRRESEERSARERDADRDDADEHRNACAMQDAAHDVAPHLVGPHPVRPRGRGERARHVLFERRVRGEDGRERRAEGKRRREREAPHGRAVPHHDAHRFLIHT